LLLLQNIQNFKALSKYRVFLGLTGYFRKFIKDYALIALLLSELLKKDKLFMYGPEQDCVFNTLKQKLSEKPVLIIFNPKAETEVYIPVYIDLVLSFCRKIQSVNFMSWKTTQAQQRYHSYELDVLVIIEAIKKFRSYLLGLSFKIITDCAAFIRTLKKKELVTRIAYWALLLGELNFIIEHWANARMLHMDLLSRYPACLTIHCNFIARLKCAQQDDPEIKALVSRF